ncbi:MAG TPA: MBL fold metallo-hydrolase [Dissulfurispiraceae bacterium]|nr:MBL fold metallo-hydrolase [Dissulfurispiraceae bacterium]
MLCGPFLFPIQARDLPSPQTSRPDVPNQAGGGRTIVVDTGRTQLPLLGLLRYRGIRTIDALVLSHAHPDHTAGLSALLRDLRVQELWDNGRLAYSPPLPPDIRHRTLARGDIISTAGGARFIALHPCAGYHAEKRTSEENNDSLVLKSETSGGSILFTDDIGEDAENTQDRSQAA